MTFLGGNPWDWVIFIILLLIGFAVGLKDDDEYVIPREIVVRSIGVFVLILVILNLPKILGFFF